MQYQQHKLDAMLRVANNPAMEKTYREVYAPGPSRAFYARLAAMSEHERAALEERLRDGFERTHAAEAPSEADFEQADPVPDDVRAWLLRKRGRHARPRPLIAKVGRREPVGE